MPSGIPNSTPTKNCEVCKESFRFSPCVEKKGHARFCSVDCQRQWQSVAKKGIKPYEVSDKSRLAQSLARLGKPNPTKGTPRPHLTGVNSPRWVGDAVGYFALHGWVRRNLGQPEECEHCELGGLTGHKIHWANISREYKRDLDDWIRLCAKCHRAYDRDKLTLAELRG